MSQHAVEMGPWTPEPSAYDYMLDLSPSAFAWEFLRRNPAFREAAFKFRNRDKKSGVPSTITCVQDDGTRWIGARRHISEAEHWGLLFFPNPDQNGLKTMPFWTPDLTGGELEAIVQPRRTVGCGLVSLSDVPGRKNVLVRFGERVRMKVEGPGYSEVLGAEAPPEAPQGKVEIAFALGEFSHIESDMERISAFAKYCRNPTEAPSRVREPFARRLIESLMALDGYLAHHSLREVAHAFHDPDQIAQEWGRTDSIRSRVRRLSARGKSLSDGCYRSLLTLKMAS